MKQSSRDIFLTNMNGIDFVVRAAEFTTPEDIIRSKMLEVLGSWIGGTVEAKTFFGRKLKKIVFALGMTERNVLGNTVKDGFILWINPYNKILDYNCIMHAVVHHEYAHWVDLTERKKTEWLGEKDAEEIKRSSEKDPA